MHIRCSHGDLTLHTQSLKRRSHANHEISLLIGAVESETAMKRFLEEAFLDASIARILGL
jgi:hypothetical protein